MVERSLSLRFLKTSSLYAASVGLSTGGSGVRLENLKFSLALKYGTKNWTCEYEDDRRANRDYLNLYLNFRLKTRCAYDTLGPVVGIATSH